MDTKLLSVRAKIALLDKAVNDFNQYIEWNSVFCPANQTYTIQYNDYDNESENKARTVALEKIASMPSGLVKLAFDTRRIDQEEMRNPRTACQYWHRTSGFIESTDERKLNSYARLMKCLHEIKEQYGNQPEWFESYARILYDNVYRILRIEQGDLEVFKPQLAYLEQLIDARYRLTPNDLITLGDSDLKNRILNKDEKLLKRGQFLQATGITPPNQKQQIINNAVPNQTTQESIINAIFSPTGLRKENERTVERTITITIRDNLIE